MLAPSLTTPDAAGPAQDSRTLLRFLTCGSVDDGKSTLIGRLLYDTHGAYEDQLASIERSSINRSTGPIDFSLLTDGLRAEREQGITIDVAYRYFATPRRKFIIADTPGHEQYTRNMATGASTAQLAVVLIDARHGVQPQSRRHAHIASLLGIPQVVVAVNKMDLAGYDQAVYQAIEREFRPFLERLGFKGALFLPLSALQGDNVAFPSEEMPWYQGPTLLSHLETVPVDTGADSRQGFRFPVQYVIRPHLDFRGYAGQIAAGTVRPGDPVVVLPSGRRTQVKTITTFDGELPVAFAPQSVTLTLEDEVDVSRGDMLVPVDQLPAVTTTFDAKLVWMQGAPLQVGRTYLLKHTTRQVQAVVRAIHHRLDVNTLAPHPASQLEMNEIGSVLVETSQPLYIDPYREQRSTGAFILIDPQNNATAGAGMVARAARSRKQGQQQQLTLRPTPVTPAERLALFGHAAFAVWLPQQSDLAYLLERALFQRGCLVRAIEPADHAPTLHAAGLITIHTGEAAPAATVEVIAPVESSVEDIVALLEDQGLLRREQSLLSGDGI